MLTYRKVVACLSSLVGSGRGRGIDHYSKVTRERARKWAIAINAVMLMN